MLRIVAARDHSCNNEPLQLKLTIAIVTTATAVVVNGFGVDDETNKRSKWDKQIGVPKATT